MMPRATPFLSTSPRQRGEAGRYRWCAMTDGRLVLLATVGAPHGVRGEVRLKSYTADPVGVGGYGPLTTTDGRTIEIVSVRPANEVVIARIRGIADRDAAERLKGLGLFVPRERLPAVTDADEFYHADLIGLRAESPEGRPIGRVLALYDFGAGDIIEIRPPSGPDITLGFTRETVPVIDIPGGRIVVVLSRTTEARG